MVGAPSTRLLPRSISRRDDGDRGAGQEHRVGERLARPRLRAVDQSYRGCEHGCVYCFARPTHSYLNLSPGLDFETRIIAKVNAAERLREALAARSYVPRSLNLGSATDATSRSSASS
jgi:DNA repair photolyase